MVESLQEKQGQEESGFIFPNQCQSLHIGCNNYGELKASEFKAVLESHNDVTQYAKFFNDELHFHKVNQIKDNMAPNQKRLRQNILAMADEMLGRCSGIGENPYSVNVITFSGHGITFDGDAIAVIPELVPDVENKVARYINMSGLARKFASRDNTLNIFILSMCRKQYKNQELEKLEKQNKNKDEEKKDSPTHVYSYLLEDTLDQAKHDGYPQKGFSIMIFACQNAKPSVDGEFIKELMKIYENAKNADRYQNIGWKLINEVIPEAQMMKFSTSSEKMKYTRIMFLNSQKQKEERAKEQQRRKDEERKEKEEEERKQNEYLDRILQQADNDYEYNFVPARVQQPLPPDYSEEEVKEAEIQDFIEESKCATDVNEKVYLKKELLGNKKYITILLYSGSLHGWMLQDFHQRCSGKGPTLSLFKMQYGACIGGYSTAQWESDPEDCDGHDPQAFLFNLTYRKAFPVKDPEMAIRRVAQWGPYFGEGELGAFDEPFNSYGMGLSLPDEPVYELKTNDQGINPLTNQIEVNFTISELEVWQIQEVV